MEKSASNPGPNSAPRPPTSSSSKSLSNLANFYGGSQENLKVLSKPSFASNMESLKPKKTLRFNLEQHQQPDEEQTPPPKEFRRSGHQRKHSETTDASPPQLLNSRSPSSSNSSKEGFVKSMCRFFNGGSPSSEKKVLLNRSNSFSVLGDSEAKIQGGGEDKRSGLFRSWSLRNRRRRRRRSSEEDTEEDDEGKERCSPSYSYKSQDSGFSDSGESNKEAKSSSSSSEEDLEDPNMTQIPNYKKTPLKTPGRYSMKG
ncbi:Uncharacterized protein FKW44_019301 [Caligus rogercresseyi]|uniref:Uncharacterized protein n=1 Tax=Caligus rogercresseyi TaxID=217165 RepID=A0A7T8GVV1_CALRO|nr:Uncharacterized protein FKW44_019301 [Caligus rogercresseyi]